MTSPHAASPPGPLAGITVVDLTRVLAGPFCTLLLADLGATVIKVEEPRRGDDARHIGPFVGGEGGRAKTSAYFASLNRGKQSIALDLKLESDRALLHELLARADVLVENFRPGTLARLGFAWDTLHARHPRLILASTSGFGATGPLASHPAYDMVVQAMGGIMSITGHPGGLPTRVGTSIGDLTAGLFTALAVNAALFHRERSGEGVRIDVAMLDCQIAILENAIARTFATGEPPGPLGARHPSIAPFALYRAADASLVIAAGNDKLFAKLAELLGRPDWPSDPRFASNEARTQYAEVLGEEIERCLARAPRQTWLERLEAAGIPCGPLQNVAEVLAHPQTRARNMLVSAPGPEGETIQMAGNPIKWSAFPDPPTRGPVPKLDEHRQAILRSLRTGGGKC